ncbi:putative Nucleolar transcription factor 1 [Hypsibius exemplaris]|uniref:Nucleolar transcription factor 1 n=1 Tax=Hypsibius exemplaris TaxID=2072580 RepID=A0A9X6NHW8_HYPEX|nr:putative Nucleolar transcription factor 1 [Hypsibius exemplaris]
MISAQDKAEEDEDAEPESEEPATVEDDTDADPDFVAREEREDREEFVSDAEDEGLVEEDFNLLPISSTASPERRTGKPSNRPSSVANRTRLSRNLNLGDRSRDRRSSSNIPLSPDGQPSSSTSRWTVKEIQNLLQSLQQLLPSGDTVIHSKRVKQIKWEKVAGQSGRTAEECRAQWGNIAARLRTYRVMSELVNDAQLLLQSQLNHLVSPLTVPRSRKRKEREDPHYPKRRMNIFLLYRSEQLKLLKAKHPKWSWKKLSDRVLEKYRALSDEEKADFSARAAAGEAQFDVAKRKFDEDRPELHAKKRRLQEALKNPFADLVTFPDKPPKPSDLYRKRYILENGRDPESGYEWTDLPNEERQRFVIEAVREETKYKESISKLLENHPDIQPPLFRSAISCADKRSLPRDAALEDVPGRPVKPAIANHPYKLFCADFLRDPQYQTQFGTSWMKKASAAWQKLSTADKTAYQDRISAIWSKYFDDTETYLATLSAREQRKERALMKVKTPRPKTQCSSSAQTLGNVEGGPARPKSQYSKRRALPSMEALPALDGAAIGSSALSLAGDASSTAMTGKNLFIYENEREYRCNVDADLDGVDVRDRLAEMFDDLPANQQAVFHKRAAKFEKELF